jgi:hypothetical protein
MPTIRVPDQPSVVITDGGEPIIYKVKDGEITVDDAHVAAILGAVSGSTLKAEPEAKKPKADATPA